MAGFAILLKMGLNTYHINGPLFAINLNIDVDKYPTNTADLVSVNQIGRGSRVTVRPIRKHLSLRLCNVAIVVYTNEL